MAHAIEAGRLTGEKGGLHDRLYTMGCGFGLHRYKVTGDRENCRQAYLERPVKEGGMDYKRKERLGG